MRQRLDLTARAQRDALVKNWVMRIAQHYVSKTAPVIFKMIFLTQDGMKAVIRERFRVFCQCYESEIVRMEPMKRSSCF
jgi:hypothetical protein